LGDPCAADATQQDVACVPNDMSSWAWYHGTASTSSGKSLTIDVRTGYRTPDPAFDPTGSTDNGLPVEGGCDQLAVIFQESTKPRLAKGAPLVTRVRTVARTTASSGGRASAALLILERKDCTAISVNSSNTFIQVKGFNDKPGVIHTDSNGTGTTCSATNPTILGKFSAPPGVSARQSETGSPRIPGLITSVAGTGLGGAIQANATDGAAKVCAEKALPGANPAVPPSACGAAGGRSLTGRGPVDQRYLVGVTAAMFTASTQYNLTPAAAALPANGYQVLPGGCNNIAGTSALVKVYVDCPNGASFKDFTFAAATTVVFNGDVKVSSTNTLSMPYVKRLYVRGSTGTNGGLQSSGTLKLNTGTALTCPTATPSTVPSAQLVVGTGSFSGGAQSTFHLCQTTVLLRSEQSGLCPLPPLPPTTGTGAAPFDSACKGYVDVNAGGAMDWSAPNQRGACSTSCSWDDLEDLALWTEASQVSSIGGGASMDITGVFFLPNANPFIISGHGNQTNAANAQFVARKLQVQGQGTLYLRPNPDDSFTLPLVTATYSLVR
jgi:hypothetical protein